MQLSVIIPVYNTGSFLMRCLDSVFVAAEVLRHRTETTGEADSVEVICVNDGSTDGSLAVLRAYKRPIVIISQPNRGQGPARDAGLARATGDFVMFLDSDDIIPAHALFFFMRAAKESGAPVVMTMSFARDDEKLAEPAFSWRMRKSCRIAGMKTQYSVCGKLFRRDILLGRRFLPCVFEDFAYMTVVFCDIDRFAAIRAPLYIYCSNAGRASIIRSGLTVRKVEDSIRVIRYVLEFARGKTSERFALRQASDGLSSAIGQVYKSHDPTLAAVFRPLYRQLVTDFPVVTGGLTLKARYRLWRMGE